MVRLSGIALATAATLLALALPAAAAAAPVPLDQAGSSGTGAGQMSAPQDVVVDGTGDIYVADSGNNRIVQFDADGDFVRAFGWGVDTGALAYEVCTSTCTSGYSGGGAGQLFSPSGLAVDGAGSLFVVSTNGHRVDQFNIAGPAPTFTKAFGYDVATGTGGTFQTCTTTCFVGNSGNDTGGQLDTPTGIDFAAGTVLVADRNNDRISVFNPAAPAHLLNFGGTGTGNGQFIDPNDVAVGAGGIFVSDDNNSRISRFAPGAPPTFVHSFGWDVELGGPLGVFESCTAMTTCIPGVSGPGAGQFSHPFGLDLDPSGSLWVADFSNNRVQQLATAGPSFTQTFGFGVNTGAVGSYEVCTNPNGCTLGSSGAGFGQPTQPVGVAVDGCGAVWVSESAFGNDRIERFGEPGTPPAPPCATTPSPPSPPSNAFSFGKAKLNRKKGTATLPVNAPGPGTLALSGKGIKGASAQTSGAAAAASTVNLTIRAKGKAAKSLNKQGKAKVTASVTFTPAGGSAGTQTKKLTLKRDR